MRKFGIEYISLKILSPMDGIYCTSQYESHMTKSHCNFLKKNKINKFTLSDSFMWNLMKKSMNLKQKNSPSEYLVKYGSANKHM